MIATIRCTDCGQILEPDEAEAPTDDGQPRCDLHHWKRESARIDARPPRHLRFWVDATCEACKHDYLVDKKALAPEPCPRCGFLAIARPPSFRTPGLIRAAAALARVDPHLSNAGPTLSMLRRERAAGK